MEPVRLLKPIEDPREAWQMVGGLSRTSKMPCYSWGLPADTCKRGRELRKLEGSICSKCYAYKGNFRRFADKAYRRRYAALDNPQWAEAMIVAILHNTSMAVPYFRWFCSGDLQSYQMLEDIAWICLATPDIQHWLPTQERQWVDRYLERHGRFPPNLTVRISSIYLNEIPEPGPLPQAAVSQTDYTCPASEQDNQCKQCRKCWDPNEAVIVYKAH